MSIIFLGITGAIFGGDLWVKNYMERNLSEGEERKILRGKIILRKHHNTGMMLNLGAQTPGVAAAASVVLALFCLVLFLLTLGGSGSRLLQTGLSLLLGGAFCNTYDRLRRKYVVDYFSFCVKAKWLRRIIFNLSDLFIMAGAMLITLSALRESSLC